MKNSLVIQAGGRSSRMGQDKGLMPLAGIPLIQHVLNRTAGLTDEILITSNNLTGYTQFGLPIFTDEQPGAGALPGLQTGLQAANGEVALVVACDMPFLNRALLGYLVDQAAEADVVVPIWGERPQPMCAVYRPSTVVPAIERALAAGEKRMISFFPDVLVLHIGREEIDAFDPDGVTFFNVNTPGDLAVAEEMWLEIQKVSR